MSIRDRASFIMTGSNRKVLAACHRCTRLKTAIIREAPDEVIERLVEILFNVLKGNVPLTPHQKRKLSRSKKTLRELIRPKVSLQRRRALLSKEVHGAIPIAIRSVQKGGFIGSLIPILLSLI